MKSKFPGYYRPTDEEFADLWQKCIFVLDTNNLLDFYRLSDETAKQYFDLLEKISDRLWLPYQIAFEYQKNRLEVIAEQASVYDKLAKTFRQTLDNVNSIINSLGRHASSKTDIQTLNSRIKKYLGKIVSELDATYNENLNRLTNEEIHHRLASLFEGKVGEAYDSQKTQEIYTLGLERYEKKMPPGFKDEKEKTEDPRKYGDLVLWLQIIDYAKAEKKPIIFITNDIKDDWWEIRKGKTIGPRPELCQEMFEQAGVGFYMYTSTNFLRYAHQYLQISVSEKGIEEVQEVALQNTEKMTGTPVGLVQLPPDFIRKISGFSPSIDFSAFSRNLLATYATALDQNNAAFAQALKPALDALAPAIYDDSMRQMVKLMSDITQLQLSAGISALPSFGKALHTIQDHEDEGSSTSKSENEQ